MKLLVWLGIEEKGTYDIIKKIAKKKFKHEEIEELKTQLKDGWIKNVGRIDGFAETWQVVQDAARYSFNASHSLSVAVDSLYGAYLKSHYPLEYFTVVLTLYSGDMDRTSKLISELPYFNIKLLPIKYGKSGADYTMDKSTNSIYKGISSIKYCNAQIADELLELSKNHYDNFIDLLKDIKEKTSLNSRQLSILIGLNFFQEFGENKYLMGIVDVYDKFSGVKIISKNKMEFLGVTDYLMAKYAGKETKSQWRELDNHGLIKELCNRLQNESMNVVEQVKWDMEYLEYTDYINNKMTEDYFIVTSFVTYKDPTKPSVVLRRICNGEEVKTRIKQSNIFKSDPFGLFSVLRVEGFTYEFKKKVVDGKWTDTEELEPILVDYETIKG